MFWKALAAIRFWDQKYDVPVKKNRCDFDLNAILDQINVIKPSYVPFRIV